MRLEYAVEKDDPMFCSNTDCYYLTKIKVYELMKGVIKNWNENNLDMKL